MEGGRAVHPFRLLGRSVRLEHSLVSCPALFVSSVCARLLTPFPSSIVVLAGHSRRVRFAAGVSILPSVLMRSACVVPGRCTSSRSLVSVRGLSGWLVGRWKVDRGSSGCVHVAVSRFVVLTMFLNY